MMNVFGVKLEKDGFNKAIHATKIGNKLFLAEGGQKNAGKNGIFAAT